MDKTTLTEKEQRASTYIKEHLSKKFGIASDLVEVSMKRHVPGMELGQEVLRDHMVIAVKSSIQDNSGETIFSIPVQHELASILEKHWKIGTPPLLEVDIPVPYIPSKASQAAPEQRVHHGEATALKLLLD
ncbi:MAG: hypothetical protein KDI13_06730 [Alphaproteobacteria bacterium]|nr:hypothetical protein [Alphaproteobacteria bacterium]